MPFAEIEGINNLAFARNMNARTNPHLLFTFSHKWCQTAINTCSNSHILLTHTLPSRFRFLIAPFDRKPDEECLGERFPLNSIKRHANSFRKFADFQRISVCIPYSERWYVCSTDLNNDYESRHIIIRTGQCSAVWIREIVSTFLFRSIDILLIPNRHTKVVKMPYNIESKS